MQCDLCGKDAQLQFTEIVGGQKRTLPLCSRCAAAHGVLGSEAPPSGSLSPTPAPVAPSLEISISSHSGTGSGIGRCKACGTTLVAIRKSGRVGCPQCYDFFREFLEPLLKRVHGVLEHRGISPGGLSENARRREERLRLREDLRHAIEAEDYEAAARLRDRLQDQGSEGMGSESS